MPKHTLSRGKILLLGLSTAAIVSVLGVALHNANWRVSCHPNYTETERMATNCQYGASIGDWQTIGAFLAFGIVGFTIFAAAITKKPR